MPCRWLSPSGVLRLRGSWAAGADGKGAGPSSCTDHCGLTGSTSTDFKATVSGQTYYGDPKLAPCGVSCLILQQQYFWFSKELNNLKCTKQKVGLRRSVRLSRLGINYPHLTCKALFVRFRIYDLSEALIMRFPSFGLTGLFSNLFSFFLSFFFSWV